MQPEVPQLPNNIESNGNEPEKAPDIESQIKIQMQPLRELVNCEVFLPAIDNTPWQVEITWQEPELDENDQLLLGNWIKFSAQGPLNQRFLDWAEKQYRYWIHKARVSLRVTKIEFLPETEGRRQASYW